MKVGRPSSHLSTLAHSPEMLIVMVEICEILELVPKIVKPQSPRAGSVYRSLPILFDFWQIIYDVIHNDVMGWVS